MRKQKSQIIIAVLFCVVFIAGVWTCSVLLDKTISELRKEIEHHKKQRESRKWKNEKNGHHIYLPETQQSG